MKAKRKPYSRKALKLAPSPTPVPVSVPVQAAELIEASPSYTPAQESTPAWYRFGF